MSQDVVFDLGGVVFHWQPLAILQTLFPGRVTSPTVAKQWATQIFQSFEPQADWSLFDLGQIEPLPLAQRIADRTGLAKDDVLHLIERIPAQLQPMVGTVDLMRELKAQGHRLYFLSNMPAPYADHLLGHTELFAQFEAGIFSAHVQQIKPLPGIFASAQARWPLRGQAMFIDDVQHNIDAAQRHGWRALRFETPQQARAALLAQGYLGP